MMLTPFFHHLRLVSFFGAKPSGCEYLVQGLPLMQRTVIAQLCEREVLETAARLFGTSKDALGKFEDYEGCANLVYHFKHADQLRILRISYRSDRPVELI